MGIEKYLQELLYSHECVIVPGFGAFIKNYEPASFKPATYIFNPPRQYVVFNSNLTINDGLLASFIASDENTSFEAAMGIIARDVTAWQERMRAGKKITLLQIGTFEFNKAGKVLFDPDTETNFFLDAYGMSGFVATPVSGKAKPNQLSGKQPGMRHRKPAIDVIRPYIKAAAITIPLIAAALWTTLNQDTIRQYARQSASMINYLVAYSPSDKHISTNTTGFESRAIEPDLETVPNEGETVPIVNEAEQLQEIMPSAEAMATHATPSAHTGRGYHIIVGSFSQQANAETLASQLLQQAYNPLVTDNGNGMFRVVLSSFASYKEALACLNEFRNNEYPDAWLLHL